MSLDKAIEHGKEHREQYRGSKAVDCTCRNNGSCEWCKQNRTIHDTRDRERCKDAMLDITTEKEYTKYHKVMK